MALLEVENLVVHYGKALALDGLSLRVDRGELVGVLGPERRRQNHAAEGDLADRAAPPPDA